MELGLAALLLLAACPASRHGAADMAARDLSVSDSAVGDLASRDLAVADLATRFDFAGRDLFSDVDGGGHCGAVLASAQLYEDVCPNGVPGDRCFFTKPPTDGF